jgi:hypothetical protein
VVDGISEYPAKWRGNTAVSGGTAPQAHPHTSVGIVITEVKLNIIELG